MNIEVLFKKYFYVGVGVLVALSAYFQANGMSNIARSFLAPETGRTPSPSPVLALESLPRPRASAIQDRNPFDSITGPLHEQPIEAAPAVAAAAPSFDNPLLVPACAGVEVLILTESDDPLWSFAALTSPTEKTPVLRRVGDKVGAQTVAYIGHNPATGSPTVWLESNTLCQASLFGVVPPAPAVAAAAPAEEPPADAAAAPAAGARALDPDIASKIRKISDTEFEVDRSAVDKILDNQADLMRSARIVPETKDGQTIGVRLFGIRPETLLGQLGLVNGDRLETINDFNMASPEKALEAYARLRTADSLKVQVNRRGKPTTIELKIK